MHISYFIVINIYSRPLNFSQKSMYLTSLFLKLLTGYVPGDQIRQRVGSCLKEIQTDAIAKKKTISKTTSKVFL